MNGRGLGRAFGVWLSVDIFLVRDGELFVSDLALELSFTATFAGLKSTKLPFIRLVGVESTTLSLISKSCPECADLDASPAAGVGAMEESGPD